MITLRQVDNGAILDKDIKQAYVFTDGDLEGLQELLYDVLEYLQPTYSRYNREKIVITLMHGDKYECRDKKCKICKEV